MYSSTKLVMVDRSAFTISMPPYWSCSRQEMASPRVPLLYTSMLTRPSVRSLTWSANHSTAIVVQFPSGWLLESFKVTVSPDASVLLSSLFSSCAAVSPSVFSSALASVCVSEPEDGAAVVPAFPPPHAVSVITRPSAIITLLFFIVFFSFYSCA